MKRILYAIGVVTLACAPLFAQRAQQLIISQKIAGGSTHGRTFNGSSQALYSDASVNLTGTSTITLSFWMKVASFNNSDGLSMESSAAYDSNSGAFVVDPNASFCTSGAFVFGVQDSTGQMTNSFTRPSTGTWHHYALIMDSTLAGILNNKAYVDGSLQTIANCISTGNVGNFGNYVVNLMSRNHGSLWAAGDLAEFAIYSHAVSAGDITSLAGGALASAVDAGNLVRYVHLCGTASPEPDTLSGNWTLQGSPTQATGPGLINCP